ncbi:MAG: hypothetical protein L3J59_07890 [Methylococcaceae bacterium]|nr:hypothetical protein [Methylococcaceae bacterium]
MSKKLILILFFYSLIANADNNSTCLIVNQEQNKLTFFYSKQGKEDKPFFYAKVLTDKLPANKNMTWQDVKGLPEHLLRLSNTEPKKYQIPDNAKVIYIVKSSESLETINGFEIYTRIVPAIQNRKKTRGVFEDATKRNTGNFIRALPKETQKLNSRKIANAVEICEFRL